MITRILKNLCLSSEVSVSRLCIIAHAHAKCAHAYALTCEYARVRKRSDKQSIFDEKGRAGVKFIIRTLSDSNRLAAGWKEPTFLQRPTDPFWNIQYYCDFIVQEVGWKRPLCSSSYFLVVTVVITTIIFL